MTVRIGTCFHSNNICLAEIMTKAQIYLWLGSQKVKMV